MRRIVVACIVMLFVVGCGGGGGSTGGGAIQGEAVKVTLAAQSTPASAVQAIEAKPMATSVALSATAENVGTVTVRGFILTHYDGGAGTTPGVQMLSVCQKCFELKDGSGLGGCNYIHHDYGIPAYMATMCQEGLPGLVPPPGVDPEHLYMSEGEGYCDKPEENPEIDCTKPPTWRVLSIPIKGFAGGGGMLNPGETMSFGGSGVSVVPPGTYQPEAAVYRWDGTMYDNDAKTVTVQ